MPLRSPNNPNTDIVVLTALRTIIPGYPALNTNVGLLNQAAGGTGLDTIYVQHKYQLATSSYPAVVIESSAQNYDRISQRSFEAEFNVELRYYDRYDQNTQLLDDVLVNIAADLERIKANIESNDSLAQGGTNYTLSVKRFSLSPYTGTIDTSYPGLSLVYRKMTIVFNLLPYDV